MLISVIIPIYNAEEHLHKSVESVLNQKNADIEIILVDDGSTDNSGKLCDEYANKYDNVCVVHKENGGLSTARNAGIKASTGTHISFLDADDYFDSSTYENIYKVIEKYNPDCIDFGWKYVNSLGEITPNLHKLKKREVLDKDYIYDNILPPLLNLREKNDNFIYDFAVNKIYKKEIIDKYNVFFDENRRTWEDRLFVVNFLKYCTSFYSIDECFYNYVSVENSLSRRYDMQFFELILSNYRKYKELFSDTYDFDCDFANNYWCHSIENMIMRSLDEKDNQEKIRDNILSVFENDTVIRWYKLRIPENEYEKTLSNYVVNHKGSEALKLYENQYKKNKKVSISVKLKSLLRRILK